MASTKDMQTRLRMTRQAHAQEIQRAETSQKAPTLAVLLQTMDWIEGAQRVVEATATKLEALNTNPRYSDLGKEEQRAKIGQEARVSMEFLNQHREKIRTDIENLRLLLTTNGKPASGDLAERVIRRMDEEEIRRGLAGKSPMELAQIFARAVEQGKDLIVSALRNAPIGPMVPQDVLDEMDRQQSEKQNPTAYERLQALKDAQQQLETLWQAVMAWLRGQGANVEGLASVVTSNV